MTMPRPPRSLRVLHQSTHGARRVFDIAESAVGTRVEHGGADALGLVEPVIVGRRGSRSRVRYRRARVCPCRSRRWIATPRPNVIAAVEAERDDPVGRVPTAPPAAGSSRGRRNPIPDCECQSEGGNLLARIHAYRALDKCLSPFAHDTLGGYGRGCGLIPHVGITAIPGNRPSRRRAAWIRQATKRSRSAMKSRE